MIKPNELRIGNKLQFTDWPHQGIATMTGENIAYAEKDPNWLEYFHKPIPITKDWLLRTDLPRNENFDRFTVFENDAFSLYCSAHTSLGFQIWFENAFDECPLEVNYLHELQNLYFALTKKELAFNPPKPD